VVAWHSKFDRAAMLASIGRLAAAVSADESAPAGAPAGR